MINMRVGDSDGGFGLFVNLPATVMEEAFGSIATISTRRGGSMSHEGFPSWNGMPMCRAVLHFQQTSTARPRVQRHKACMQEKIVADDQSEEVEEIGLSRPSREDIMNKQMLSARPYVIVTKGQIG